MVVAARPRKAVLGIVWSATDYVLRGIFCPLTDLQDALDDVRGAAGAIGSLLLVADERAVLGSLCMYSPRADELGTAILAALRGSSRRGPRRGLQDLIRPPTDEREHAKRFPASAQRILDRMSRLLRDAEDPAAAGELGASQWAPLQPHDAKAARISVALLLREQTVAVPPTATAATRVLEMVNGTAQANIRRDTVVMGRVRDLLALTAPDSTFEAAVSDLLDVAVDVSGSDFGACYVPDATRQHLVRIAHTTKAPGYPESVPVSAASAVSVAARLHQTIQAPPGLPTVSVEPTWAPSDGVAETVELVMPAPGPRATPRSWPVALLSVGKTVGKGALAEVTAYGAYDLALLRNVALRVALLDASTQSAAAAAAASRLGTGRDTARRQVDDEPPSTSPTEQDELPSDLRMAMPQIRRSLQAIARVTGSHSATFRIARAEWTMRTPHGLVLERVAAYPGGNDDVFRSQRPPGVNWDVVHTGVAQNVPDVRQHEGFVSHRSDTRSELSMPVRVEGRVVGIVNLESPDENAYESTAALAAIVASQVALNIADARLDGSRQLQRFAAQILNHGHTLSGELDEYASDLALANGDPLVQEAVTRLRAFAKHARGLRRLEADEESWAPATMPQLVGAAIRTVGIEFDSISVDDAPNWRPYREHETSVIAQILFNLFDNLKRHRSIDDPLTALVLSGDTWGGLEEDTVTIENAVNEQFSADDVPRLHQELLVREPEGKGRVVPRLGAFLAGQLARSLGGTIMCSFDPPSRRLRTTLAIPRPTEAS